MFEPKLNPEAVCLRILILMGTWHVFGPIAFGWTCFGFAGLSMLWVLKS